MILYLISIHRFRRRYNSSSSDQTRENNNRDVSSSDTGDIVSVSGLTSQKERKTQVYCDNPPSYADVMNIGSNRL